MTEPSKVELSRKMASVDVGWYNGQSPHIPSRGVVGAKVFDDVVLDQWISGPAVDGEVAVSAGVECAAV